MGRISPNYYVQDGVVPRTKLPEVLGRIRAARRARSGLRIGNVFHAGDGNLHPLICYDERIAGQSALAERVAGEILIYCVEAGGSITGEHGVGADKKEFMPKMFSDDDLDVMQSVRDAFDPKRLCNPGKVLPTPRLCGEVPGPYREHPVEARRTGRAVLMTVRDAHPTGHRRGRDRWRRARQVVEPGQCRGAGADARGGIARSTADRAARRWHEARVGPCARPRSISSSARAKLNRLLAHRHGDLTVTVQAGMPLARLQSRSSPSTGSGCRSRAPSTRATIGGIVATNDAGPLRHRFGTPRDLLIGVTLAMTDGRLVKAGGTVVKNVAGYDLGKLVSGSFGTLAGDRRRDVQAAADAAGVDDARGDLCRRRRAGA